MRNNYHEVTKAIYNLKRTLSKTVVVQKILETTRDTKTGSRTRAMLNHRVRRAVVGDTSILKKFIYDLAYIATNKNFTTGALFDQYDTLFIIDGKDLPKGLSIDHDSRLVLESQLYEIKSFTMTPDKNSYVIHGRALTQYESFELVSQYLNLRGTQDD